MKMQRLLALILIVCVLSMSFGAAVFADDNKPLDWMKKKPDNEANETKESIDKLGANVYTIVIGFGYIAGFILLVVWGIKHWFAGGDSSAKKELKEQGVNWLIGAIIVFGTSFIFNLIYNFVVGFNK